MNTLGGPEPNWEELQAVLAKRGVVINVLAPFMLLAIGYVLRSLAVFPEIPVLDEPTHQLVLYALGALALGELAAAFFVKKTLLSPSRLGANGTSFGQFNQRCTAGMTVVFAVGASPAVYGIVLYALGGTIEQFIFFVLISLVGYRFVRPGKAELERLWNRITGEPEL